MGDGESSAPGPDTETVEAARRELGEMLADFRNGAGLSLRQLGQLTGFHHTVVAHSEKGRSSAGEAFWKLVDNALHADGALTAQYDQVRNLELAVRERARQEEQAAREERAAGRLSRKRTQSQAPVPAGPVATMVCPNCCVSIELVPRLPAGQEPGMRTSS